MVLAVVFMAFMLVSAALFALTTFAFASPLARSFTGPLARALAGPLAFFFTILLLSQGGQDEQADQGKNGQFGLHEL
jgi:hypothetical protein